MALTSNDTKFSSDSYQTIYLPDLSVSGATATRIRKSFFTSKSLNAGESSVSGYVSNGTANMVVVSGKHIAVSGATASDLGYLITNNSYFEDPYISSGGGIIVPVGSASGGTISSEGVAIIAGVSGAHGGTYFNPSVESGGVVVVGEFTAKGQAFDAGGVLSGGSFAVGAVNLVRGKNSLAVGGSFQGEQVVLEGATAHDGVFSSGGVQTVGGYLISSVDSGGTHVGLTNEKKSFYPDSAYSGGTAFASGATFITGGTGITLSGGTTLNAVVSSGGELSAASGGTVESSTVNSGASLTIESGGVGSANIINGGRENIENGASEFGATVFNNGQIYVEAGGSANNIFASNGTIEVSGGNVSNSIIQSGGTIEVGGGARRIVTDVSASGGSGDSYLASGMKTYTYQPQDGLAIGTRVGNGGVEYVSGGNVSAVVETYVTSTYLDPKTGAIATISALVKSENVVYPDKYKGVASNTQILSGGSSLVTSGGTAISPVISSGGVQSIYNDGVVSGATVNNGGVIDINLSGSAVNTQLYGSASLHSGGTAASTIISKGGTLTAENGGILTGTTVVSGGGTLVIAGNNGNSVVDIAGESASNPATIIIKDSIENVNETFTGWSEGDRIVFQNVSSPAASVSFPSDNQITFLIGSRTVTLTINNIKNSYKFIQSGNNLILEVCFLAGTMIRMKNGLVAVEDIKVGDTVMVRREDGTFIPETIKWVGKKQATVRVSNVYPDEAGYPVRIKKDALGDGVPYEDLLVTSEHCLFINNAFVPVRMLVNGNSIVYDMGKLSYEYFHIETQNHSIIEANGILTESYLNTGNKVSFELHPESTVAFGYFEKIKDWKTDAAAPLVTERSFVESIYNAIVKRSGIEEYKININHNADLHLIVPVNGSLVRPVKRVGNIEFSYFLQM